MHEMDHASRAGLHCGWMDDEDWLPYEGPAVLGADAHPIDLSTLQICPGWLVRQPAVVESTRAAMALQQGELSTVFPGREAALLEGAGVVQQALNVYEAEMVKRASKGGS